MQVNFLFPMKLDNGSVRIWSLDLSCSCHELGSLLVKMWFYIVRKDIIEEIKQRKAFFVVSWWRIKNIPTIHDYFIVPLFTDTDRHILQGYFIVPLFTDTDRHILHDYYCYCVCRPFLVVLHILQIYHRVCN